MTHEFHIDIDQVFMEPTPNGMAFSKPGGEEVAMVDIRLHIKATSAEDWYITNVAMLTISRHKITEHPLEGDFLGTAKEFFETREFRGLGKNLHYETIQEAVEAEMHGQQEMHRVDAAKARTEI